MKLQALAKRESCFATCTGEMKTKKASTWKTLQAFMDENPGITAEQMYIPDAGDPYLQKMNAMAASKTLPDGALFPDDYTLGWALKGMFLDLSEVYSGEHEKVNAFQCRTPDGALAVFQVTSRRILLPAPVMLLAKTISNPPWRTVIRAYAQVGGGA